MIFVHIYILFVTVIFNLRIFNTKVKKFSSVRVKSLLKITNGNTHYVSGEKTSFILAYIKRIIEPIHNENFETFYNSLSRDAFKTNKTV